MASGVVRKYYPQWRALFEDRASKFWFCLFSLLLIDALANPYAGIVHDARLYAAQALSHLYPQRFARDLFFLHGSQDSFSLFSTIHAGIIEAFGLHYGSWLLYLASRLLLYGGILFSFRRLFRDNVLAFIACCLIAAGPVKYIFFEVNEPFLTPRLAAMGLSLFSLGLAYSKRNVLSVFLLFTAGLLHPLIALGPGMILGVFWLYKRQWSIIAGLAFTLIAASAAMVLLRPEAMKSLLLTIRFDQEWLAIIRQRSAYLFPFNWSRDEWLTIGSGIGLVLLGLRYFDRQQREFFLIITAVAALGILFTVADVAGPKWILPFQLQLWRSLWVLQILSPAVACLISLSLWRSGHFSDKLAGVLIATSFLLAGGAAASTAPWLMLAAIFVCFPLIKEAALSARAQQCLLVGAVIILLLLPLPMIVENLMAVTDCSSEWCRVFAAIAELGPFFRPAALAGAAVFFSFGHGKGSKMQVIPVLALLVLLSVITSRSQFEYPQISMAERNFFKQNRPAPVDIAGWHAIIPAGALILGDGALPTEAIWFDLQAGSYYSVMQGPGMLFSRPLAEDYEKRQQEVSKFFNGSLKEKAFSWCREKGIDFVISRKKIPLPLVGELHGIRLYSVSTLFSGNRPVNDATTGGESRK